MTRLRLKPTPEERAAKRAAKDAESSRKKKRIRCTDDEPPSNGAIRAELEEMQFREKMWGALEDDERLGGIDARFNDYAHIPDRWSRDEHDRANPQYMDDDEYAEWVREGMWKKKHAREYKEQAKRDAEKAARKKREKEIKAETARLERLALEREERRRREKQTQREDEYRRQYEEQWKSLLDSRTRGPEPLTFWDVPWPLFSAYSAKQKASDSHHLRMEDITPQAVTAFLLPTRLDDMASSVESDDNARRIRDKLKETLLRFHPDKFEGRVIHRIHPNDIERVRDAVGQVARILNVLMNEQ